MSPRRLLHAAAAALALAAGLLPAAAWAQRSAIASPRPIPADITPQINPRSCGHFRGHFGPMDFRTAHQVDRRVVEEWHFDMELQTFLSGQIEGRNMAGTGGVVFGFLYTLKSFPNHPVALLVLDQLGRKLKSESPQGIEYPIECWFMRAFMIAPDDPAVRALYGIYLAFRDRKAEAVHNLTIGEQGTQRSLSLQHQIGLAWVHLQEWQRAQLIAMRLDRGSFPLDVVARQVRRAGKWDAGLRLPPPADGDGDTAAASATAAQTPASTAAQ